MEISPDQLPAGWTNDSARLQRIFYPGSGESRLARCHGLTEFTLILRTTPDTGEMGYILESGEDYYWGDLMIDYIFKITKPKTLPEILQTLATKGDAGLKMKELKPVEEICEQVAREEAERAREEWEQQEERRQRGEEEPYNKKLFTPIG